MALYDMRGGNEVYDTGSDGKAFDYLGLTLASGFGKTQGKCTIYFAGGRQRLSLYLYRSGGLRLCMIVRCMYDIEEGICFVAQFYFLGGYPVG